MNTRYFLINLKTYEQSTGENAMKIAKAVKKLEKEAMKKNVEIILCPQNIDLRDISKLKIPTFAQHFDPIEPGQNTGFVSANAIKSAGACGSLLNHSEHQIPIPTIEKSILISKAYNLRTCVCARDENVAEHIAILKIKPDFIAVEPKELIGGDISISTAKPTLISKSLAAVRTVPLLVGAGIKNSQDVKIALELGAKGILVASGITKAPNPYDAIKELLNGF